MSYLKVVTHDTTFHADDVMAVALLKYIGYDVHIFRTREQKILQAALTDPEVAVLDVGGSYDPIMFNFDHHQDASLKSAAGLIWDHFRNKICEKDAQPFFDAFIQSIDVMDTNRDNIYEQWDALPSGFRNTSGIIGGFNRDVTNSVEQTKQFHVALDFAETIIRNELYNAEKKAKAEVVYQNRVVLPNNIAVLDEHSAIWKEKGDHLMVVQPHVNGWQITSKNSAYAQVPESAELLPGFVFRHKSGFMAVVKQKEVAVEFAATL
jgi:uncharacterized UPF0160 family protein